MLSPNDSCPRSKRMEPTPRYADGRAIMAPSNKMAPLMYDRADSEPPAETGRAISLAPDLPAIPESLLLAHARGDVLFLCGAGVSRQACLPDFRQLVLGVYQPSIRPSTRS